MPSELAYTHCEKAFGNSGGTLLLFGPVGQHLLEDCLHSDQQAAVVRYLDLVGVVWGKSITEVCLKQLEEQVP